MSKSSSVNLNIFIYRTTNNDASIDNAKFVECESVLKKYPDDECEDILFMALKFLNKILKRIRQSDNLIEDHRDETNEKNTREGMFDDEVYKIVTTYGDHELIEK